MDMRILVVGGGGREHCLAWKLAASPKVERVFVAPGNAGTAQEQKITSVDLPVDNFAALAALCRDKDIQLTVVGPEQPLAQGIVDYFTERGLPCFGPTKAAAQLESSKIFCKEFCLRYHIPTASYQSFDNLEAALLWVREQRFPLVVKADGLAAGKGVTVAHNLAEAEQALHRCFSEDHFGSAGHKVVIEEFLEGEELSFTVVTDGRQIIPLMSAQDHKARDEGDKGPNTGGMGAYAPMPRADKELEQTIMQQFIEPTLAGMAEEQRPYRGFLYAGLMLEANGSLKLLEYNCRLGDPETQVILPALDSDFAILLDDATHSRPITQPKWRRQSVLGVVMAASGYPEAVTKGFPISGLTVSDEPEQVKVFHSGTHMDGDRCITNGGRVLTVCGMGENLDQAADRAYKACKKIHWQGCFYRRDIGHRVRSL